MKIFLDDVRMLPKALREEGGWTIARNGEECLRLIRNHGLAEVEAISFDNDLGSGRMMGYQVLDTIERMVVEGNVIQIPAMTVHSANPVAVERMRVIIEQIQGRVEENWALSVSDKILSAYPDGLCPDCGDNIPSDVQFGEECPNCGHIFWDEQAND